MTKKKSIELALQGGGSHGALTWGVLERLLEEKDLKIEGISGTSAGAMNAVVLAHGMKIGGAEGAISLLHKFWENVSKYIKEARKDPEFRKDLKAFIAVSTGNKSK